LATHQASLRAMIIGKMEALSVRRADKIIRGNYHRIFDGPNVGQGPTSNSCLENLNRGIRSDERCRLLSQWLPVVHQVHE